ncbi:MAG: hypothetical protein RL095_3316 [Verrucomicrobiota bacterium]|jgi:predicted phosphodiesterase
MLLTLISDTHGAHSRLKIAECDALIHAGDFSAGRGGRDDLSGFLKWFAVQPARVKILVAGNHDFYCQNFPAETRDLCGEAGVIYLQDEEARAGSLRVWGSPWQPEFGDWAFNLPRGSPLARMWSAIPEEIDILVTHGPPWGILDATRRGPRVGCEMLRHELERVRPRLHLFGHIHEDAGRLEQDGTIFVNASCWEFGQPLRQPQILRLEPRSQE